MLPVEGDSRRTAVPDTAIILLACTAAGDTIHACVMCTGRLDMMRGHSVCISAHITGITWGAIGIT